MEEQNQNALEKVNYWMKNSLMLKLGTITILILLLLIPGSMIQNLIYERETLSRQTGQEVSNLWANRQTVIGPILTVPVAYEYTEVIEGRGVVKSYSENLHILPSSLIASGDLSPETLKRGIYEVVVYESNIDIAGTFDLTEINPSRPDMVEIRWDEATLSIGISDLRGITNPLQLQVNDQIKTIRPGVNTEYLTRSGVSTDLDLSEELPEPFEFSFTLNLQGSENLSFVPVGSMTQLDLSSPWSSPSFNGNFLPAHREVSDSGFTANWQILELNRSYPNWWIGEQFVNEIHASTFGTDMIMTMDDYQKSMRSAKYSIMTIGLTFLIFFIIEVINKRKIHPFQYALVGLSLSIYYALLVSLSEHITFNLAYLISTLVIMSMISFYAFTIFKKRTQTFVLTTIMTGFYGFMFVTLQLSDYALLLGSVGLILILSLTMYFTRNINWYGLSFKAESSY